MRHEQGYAKGRRTREEILDAALDVIAREGYAAASVQQVADAVGVTKQAVLHHFGSREGLLTAVLERRDLADRERVADLDVVTALVSVVRHNAEVPGLVALFAALAGTAGSGEVADDGPARQFFRRRTEQLVADVAAEVDRRRRSGEAGGDVDAHTVAALLVAAADGLQTQFLLDPRVDMAAGLEELWRALTGSEVARPG